MFYRHCVFLLSFTNDYKTDKIYFHQGDGYCRSEGVVVVYLQKRSNAKRIYCTVVHSKTNSDGNKEQGILRSK